MHAAGSAWVSVFDHRSKGQSYPIYNLTAPSGMYGHVEPVIGIHVMIVCPSRLV
eukprot:COSAG05_NODE_8261_length_721_cov_0.963023_2_plen_53_part_01